MGFVLYFSSRTIVLQYDCSLRIQISILKLNVICCIVSLSFYLKEKSSQTKNQYNVQRAQKKGWIRFKND